MPVLALTLQGCSMFSDVSAEVLEEASRAMDIVNLKRREVLLRGGAAFSGLGVVLQGRLQAVDRTLDGREVSLQTVEQNEAFGHAALLARRPFALTWVAATPATVAVMGADRASRLLRTTPLGMKVAQDLAEQVNEHLSWQKLLSVTPISSRVCAWACWACVDGRTLVIPKHAELAWRLNTTRESITRTFQKLLSEGLLSRDGDAWRITDPVALAQQAQGEFGDST